MSIKSTAELKRSASWPGGADDKFLRPLTPSQKQSHVHVRIQKTKKISTAINKNGLLDKKRFEPLCPTPRHYTDESQKQKSGGFQLPYPLSIPQNVPELSRESKSAFKPYNNPFSPPPPLEPTSAEELARLWEDYT